MNLPDDIKAVVLAAYNFVEADDDRLKLSADLVMAVQFLSPESLKMLEEA